MVLLSSPKQNVDLETLATWQGSPKSPHTHSSAANFYCEISHQNFTSDRLFVSEIHGIDILPSCAMTGLMHTEDST